MNLLVQLKNYVIDSYAEMKKVTWPTKEQTINYSLVVIGLSVFLVVFFAILDNIFNFGVSKLITR